ncbi:MAG: hypothetical protein ABSF34_22320, partial [Verrucomicrobiota bacterium]
MSAEIFRHLQWTTRSSPLSTTPDSFCNPGLNSVQRGHLPHTNGGHYARRYLVGQELGRVTQTERWRNLGSTIFFDESFRVSGLDRM